MVKDIAYYVHFCRATLGKTETECSVSDYKAFLSPFETVAQATAGLIGVDLQPVSQLRETQAEYLNVVRQIFANVPFGNVVPLGGVSVSVQPPKVPQLMRFYENYLRPIEAEGDRRTREAVEATVGRMNEYLADRVAFPDARIAGLVVGRVQSGKTRNYIGFMLRAIADGWNVIIALTSDNTALAKQTRDRIYGDFTQKGGVVTGDSCEVDFCHNSPHPIIANSLATGSKCFYWGVAMKETTSLERVHKWLEQNAAYHQYMRVLVIDDEADNATPDSKAGANDDKYTDDDIQELVEGVRDEEDVFEPVAEWIEYLVTLALPDKDDPTPTGRLCDELRAVLASGKGKAQETKILGNVRFRNLLGLTPIADANGNVIDLAKLVGDFFSVSKGVSVRNCKNFVRLLQYVCDVSITRSKINNDIIRIVDKVSGAPGYTYPFPACAYIGYTATPYACILNERPDETEIYPAFIRSLEKSPQYFGLDAIFGQDVMKPGDTVPKPPHMPIIHDIEEDDLYHILHPLQGVKDPPKSHKDKKTLHSLANLDNNLDYPVKGGTKKSWDTMKRALAWACCTAAVRRYNRLRNGRSDSLDARWTTMLVNVSQKKDAHQKVQKWISAYFKNVCKDARSRKTYKAFCLKVWKDETRFFTAEDFDRIFNASHNTEERYGDTFAKYPSWNEIEGDLDYFLSGAASGALVHVLVINSKDAASKANQALYNQDFEAKQPPAVLNGDHLWILSGGNILSRGLTLSGLTVSYFDRVRKTVAVDTMTQMGRWFGYRRGYELLPRLWLEHDSVEEFKKTAVLEARMHDSIKDNFNAGFSPAEDSHYQLVYTFGRKLSGRARAQRDLTIGLGTVATTNDVTVDVAKQAQLWQKVGDFLKGLRAHKSHRLAQDYEYHKTALWTDVNKAAIDTFLTSVMDLYPQRSQLMLNSLLQEIRNDESGLTWDIVVGEPVKAGANDPVYDFGLNREFTGSNQAPTSVIGAVAHYTNARFLVSYLAAIPRRVMNYESAKVLKQRVGVVIPAAEEVFEEGGREAEKLDAALPQARAGEGVKERLLRLADQIIAAYEANGEPVPEFPPAVRELFRGKMDGFRGRSSMELFNAVHESAGHLNPTLQFYVTKPPAGSAFAPKTGPVAISFFWPKHEPDDFHAVAVGLEPAPKPVTNVKFYKTVFDILTARNFPMFGKDLFFNVQAKLGAKLTKSKFDSLIANPPSSYAYSPVDGIKGGYCINAWSPVPAVRLYSDLVRGAVEILQKDGRSRSTEQLIRAFTKIEGNELFGDFFKPGNQTNRAELKGILERPVNGTTISVKAGLSIVKQHPITYKFKDGEGVLKVGHDITLDDLILEATSDYLAEKKSLALSALDAKLQENITATPAEWWKSGVVGTRSPLPEPDEIAYGTLNTEPYLDIRSGEKRVEYREGKPYWDSRLMDKRVKAMKFALGASKVQMVWEVVDIKKTKNGEEIYYGTIDPESMYEIELGKRLV